MKKTGRRAVAFVVIIVFALGMAGCTTFDNFKATFIDKDENKEKTIQIGVLEPVTGADSQAAEAEIRGIQLANTVHPEVNGKRVSLVFSDNKSDIDAAETAAQTLIEKEPLVILGSYGSVYSMAASPYIKEAKIPAISISNTNPLVTKNNDYYYRVCYVDSNQGELLARYVTESKDDTKAGVLLPEYNDAAMDMATSFTKRMKEDTGDDDCITYYEKYKTGQKNFGKELNILKKSGVKSVILPGDYTDAANIINQAAEMNLNVEFLGDTTWGTEDFEKLLENDVTDADLAFVQFFSKETSSAGAISDEAITDERKAFLEAYEDEYGKDSEPTDEMALGYDAYFVAIDAIEDAAAKTSGEVTGEEVNKVLADSDYTFEGASGFINFDSQGNPIKTAYISTIRYGDITTLYTVEAEK